MGERISRLAPYLLLQPRDETLDLRARGGVRGDDDEIFAGRRDAILKRRDQRAAFQQALDERRAPERDTFAFDCGLYQLVVMAVVRDAGGFHVREMEDIQPLVPG